MLLVLPIQALNAEVIAIRKKTGTRQLCNNTSSVHAQKPKFLMQAWKITGCTCSTQLCKAKRIYTDESCKRIYTYKWLRHRHGAGWCTVKKGTGRGLGSGGTDLHWSFYWSCFCGRAVGWCGEEVRRGSLHWLTTLAVRWLHPARTSGGRIARVNSHMYTNMHVMYT